MLWTRLLYARSNHFGMESVAARAERIYSGQNPPALLGFASARNSRALALQQENRLAEAEPLTSRRWRFGKKPWGRSTQTWPPASTTWRCSTTTRANSRRPNPFMSGRQRHWKRLWARSIQTWRHVWKTMRSCYETWIVRTKPSRWKLARGLFGLKEMRPNRSDFTQALQRSAVRRHPKARFRRESLFRSPQPERQKYALGLFSHQLLRAKCLPLAVPNHLSSPRSRCISASVPRRALPGQSRDLSILRI
jgi:hypothetical protein